jgi:REP element-mobilizing transposase RayT
MRFPRLDFAGARHHVINRGARRESIFLHDGSRALFLRVLSEFPERFSVHTHGFALMPNHYHRKLESVTGDLPSAMRHLSGSYLQRLNRLHR